MACPALTGNAVQDECSRYIRENGEVPTGELFISKAGRLKFEAIIHAVGPIYKDGRSNEKTLLYQTINKILKACESHKWSKVAMPAISTGIYGFPLDKAASIIAECIEDFTKNSNNIDIIQIVDMNAKAIGEFQKILANKHRVETLFSAELDVKLPLHDVQKPPQYNFSGHMTRNNSVSKSSSYKSEQKTSISRPSKYSRSPLKLVKGILVDQKVDVIVNSASQEMDLNRGIISKMIYEKGGSEIQDECTDYIQKHGNLKFGNLAITDGYNLPCKYIFHGVCAQWDNLGGTCETAIKLIVKTSLEEADRYKCQSIAMPSFGTGNLGVPAKYTAKWMYEAVEEYFNAHPSSQLKDLRVVVYNRDFPTIKAFEAFLCGSSEESVSVKKSDRKIKEMKKNETNFINGGTEKGFSINMDHLVLEICQGDITAEKTDAIVNSTDGSFGQMGNVAQAIIEKGGEALQEEYKKINKVKRVVRTGSGNLPFRYIYHINSLENWSMVEDCLEKADKDKVTSIAFPLLGTGVKSDSISNMADVFLRYIVKFNNKRPPHLKKIRIVIYQADKFSEFKKMVEANLSPGFLGRIANYFKPKEYSSLGLVVEDYKLSKDNVPSSIKFNIYSSSRDDISKAKKELNSSLDDYVTTKRLGSVWRDIISELTTDEINALDALTNGSCVEMKIDRNNEVIELHGLIKDVDNLYDKIIELLNSQKSKMEKDKETENILKNVKWMFYDDQDGYIEYPKEITSVIEKAFDSKKNSATWSEEDGVFTVKFDEMKEHAPSRSPVLVKRVVSDCCLPLTWDYMDENVLIQNVELSPSSKEYKEVKDNIKLTAGASLRKVVKIERIQNPNMYKQFALAKDAMKKMYKSNPSIVVERTLWHGTSSDTIQAITKEGFNRSYSGKNATCYGLGSYFARDFRYSAHSTYSRPDIQGYKHIFQCSVLTGEFAQGSQNLNVPPAKSNNTKYDSTVDDTRNPSIFVVYNDTHAYPEYIITFI